MNKQVKLGDRVKDRISGFQGIAVARTEYWDGSFSVGVQGEELLKGLPADTQWIQEVKLTVLADGAVAR